MTDEPKPGMAEMTVTMVIPENAVGAMALYCKMCGLLIHPSIHHQCIYPPRPSPQKTCCTCPAGADLIRYRLALEQIAAMEPNDEAAIDRVAKVIAEFALQNWDGLGEHDNEGRYPDSFRGTFGLEFNNGKHAFRRAAKRAIAAMEPEPGDIARAALTETKSWD